MSLRDIELRILGALIEKERTTPDQYPLSTNALVAACNQKTNREPVTNYGLLEVEEALQGLRDKGLVTTVRADHERAYKHRHLLSSVLELDDEELALLAVLMLRGQQTPGELRSRTERYVRFADLAAVEAALARLAAHRPPLAKNYGRGPGQSQDRWGQTLGRDPEKLRPRVRSHSSALDRPAGDSTAAARSAAVGSRADGHPAASAANAPGDEIRDEIATLRREVEMLRSQLAKVLEHLGLSGESLSSEGLSSESLSSEGLSGEDPASKDPSSDGLSRDDLSRDDRR